MCPIKVRNFKICRLCNEQGPYNYRNTNFASIFLWGWSLLYYILWKLSHLVLLLYWNTCILKHGYIVLSWLSRLNPMNLHVFIHNLLNVLLYKEFYLIRQIIDPLMLYILGYMCQNENIDASAINTEKWKGTKLRAASQKSSKMVIKISSTSNQMKVSSNFFSSELSNIMI